MAVKQIAVFWDMMPCNLGDRCEWFAHSPGPSLPISNSTFSLLDSFFYPEDEGNPLLENVGSSIPNYTASRTRRL
jgi:hypothetical protein